MSWQGSLIYLVICNTSEYVPQNFFHKLKFSQDDERYYMHDIIIPKNNYQKIVERSLYGNINASRNSA